MRRLYRQFLARIGRELVGACARPGRRPSPWNRTPEHIEEEVVRLHVEQPQLGAGQLRYLAARLLCFNATRETIRRILLRRGDLVVSLEQARRRRPRRIRVAGRCELWGADLTLVWVLGFIPVWVLGVVDYHGSRLLLLEPVGWPTSARIASVLGSVIGEHGAPQRLLTDRGPVFCAPPVEQLLAQHGVRHVLTKPAHAWTNGRIERVFRTFKEAIFSRVWLLASLAQLRRFCADFRRWYNRDRPHSAWAGRTPDEVYFDRPPDGAKGRVTYFDGLLAWYRFG